MDPQQYEMFCRVSPMFFDNPERLADDAGRFDAGELAGGWRCDERGLWISCRPVDLDLPEQGWKIHVSVTLDEAADVLSIVSGYCLRNGVAFKFLRSRETLLLANAKQAGRATSGKFIAVYPVDDARFERVLTELDDLLDGRSGPYVLSDLRYGAGPLYVRYGGFTALSCGDPDHGQVPAIRRPDGVLVPDRREPVFRLPDWVSLPEFLRPHLAARSAGAGEDFPYAVVRVLHFSNGGGIYEGTETGSGRRVVLREARPHAGLDRTGADAVARLDRERAVLQRLAGLDCVPRLIDVRTVAGHRFLVEEFVEGRTLLDEVVQRYPLVHPDPAAESVADYTAWATGILDAVAAAMAAVHARGVRYGDLHPGNVIVRPDGGVTLIDFEIAGDATDTTAPALGAPGFAAPDGVRGVAADLAAMAVLRLFVFLPLVAMLSLDRAKAPALAAVAAQNFPLPQGFPTEHGAADDVLFETPDWPALRDALADGIHATATPDRTDRLFPGDPDQFGPGALGIAHGAAGVLYALHQAGCEVPGEYIDWLVRATHEHPDPACGLYDGLHGVATVLDLLGRTDEAVHVLHAARAREHQVTAAGMFRGWSGVGLNLLHFAAHTGDDALRRDAVGIADRLGEVLPKLPVTDRPNQLGLFYGGAGIALLHLAVFEDSGDEHYLDLARQALQRDLDHGARFDDGSFQLRNGTRNVSYLDGGSGGVALAVRRYLRHRAEDDLEAMVTAARHGCHVRYVQQPQLFRGRAGVIAILAELGAADDRAAIDAHVRGLGWHALRHKGKLMFPGNQLLRISTDLATGSAGVLLALSAAFAPAGPVLPLLRPHAIPVGSTQGR